MQAGIDFTARCMAAEALANGGSGGTSDYTQLTNKPSINSVELDGNKTSANLGLQSAIDSTHKLDADLVDDTSSTNKFATAAELAQIETNKTNILSVYDTGYAKKNLLDSNAVTTVKNGITFTVNADKSITISGTNSVNDTTNLPITSGYVSNIWKGKKLSGCTGGSNTSYALACMYSNDGSTYVSSGYQTDGEYIIENYNYIYIIVTVYNNYAISGTKTLYPMIRDIGDSTYQPYAMSNADLTTLSKQNQTNILLSEQMNGAKNIFRTNPTSTPPTGITVNSDGTVTINGTFASATEFSLGTLTGTYSGYSLLGCTGGADNTYKLMYQYRISGGSVQVLKQFDAPVDFNLSNITWSALTIRIEAGQTVNTVIKPMICKKDFITGGMTDYQPYALSNVDLTTLSKQNQTNISLCMKCATAEMSDSMLDDLEVGTITSGNASAAIAGHSSGGYCSVETIELNNLTGNNYRKYQRCFMITGSSGGKTSIRLYQNSAWGNWAVLS